MNLLRIDHVSLDVDDRARSVAWYQRVLGLPSRAVSDRVDEPTFVGTPTARLGLFQQRDPGLRHIALATDVKGYGDVLKRLRALHIPHTIETHGAARSIYFADPDGTVLEVTTT